MNLPSFYISLHFCIHFNSIKRLETEVWKQFKNKQLHVVLGIMTKPSVPFIAYVIYLHKYLCFQVAIVKKDNTTKCGAVLVSSRYLVTAAHCVDE